MESNPYKIDYVVLFHPLKSRDEKNLTKPKDVVEYFVQKNNDENKVKDKANHETTERQNNDFGLNISLFKKFEKTILNFLEYSTIGGLSELGKRKDLFLRIYWMIVVFICASYALVTFIETEKLFFNNDVNLAFEKYQDLPNKFPAITICNSNPFYEQYAFSYLEDKFNFYHDYGSYNYLPEKQQLHFSNLLIDLISRINQLKRTLINDLNETELSSMGYDLDSALLISCQYNGNLCSEKNGDFKRFWNNIYGNCYTFNGGNNSFLTGDQNGLHLEMIVSK
jgi:hypothetical protein